MASWLGDLESGCGNQSLGLGIGVCQGLYKSQSSFPRSQLVRELGELSNIAGSFGGLYMKRCVEQRVACLEPLALAGSGPWGRPLQTSKALFTCPDFAPCPCGSLEPHLAQSLPTDASPKRQPHYHIPSGSSGKAAASCGRSA